LLDKFQLLPLYYQVKEKLMDKITNKYFEIGDLIPSETELQETYKVSRITIRRAIQELVQEGYLSTQQGKGTFVSKPKASQELDFITGWAETMNSLGMHPHTENLSFTEEPVSTTVAKYLNIHPGDMVYKLYRIRYVNNEPICLMTNYLIPTIVPGILEKGLINESLYETLEKVYGIALNRAEEIVEAKAAKAKEASLLQIIKGSPLLHATRVTYDINNQPVELVYTLTRGDRYSYTIKLSGRQKPLN